MSEVYSFDMLTIARVVKQKKRFIIIASLATAILGVTLWMAKPKKYTAETEFFLQNPFYADRNFLFNYETKFIDYFANDDEVNRLKTLSESDVVLNSLIDSFDLATVYDFDTTDAEEKVALREHISSHVKILRSDKRTVLLSYTDKDAEFSAQMANAYAFFLEKTLRNVYNHMRANMNQSVSHKAQDEQALLNKLTDSLVKLREHYEIYDLINPGRYSFVLTPIKPNGKPDFAEGIEKIQNIAALKDELVKNMAAHITLKNQYSTGIGEEEMFLTHLVREAKKPIKPKGPGLLSIGILGFALGFGFSLVYSLMANYYQYIKNNI